MNDFEFLNLHTEYECSGDEESSLNVHLLGDHDFCFRWVFKYFNNYNPKFPKQSYTIRVYTDLDVPKSTQWNNLCLLPTSLIKKHLDLGKIYIHPYKYKLIENERSGKKCLDIKIDLEAKSLYHKVLLNWVRYLYEFPNNVVLYDAYKLKSEFKSKFRFINMLDMFNIVSGCTPATNYRTDQIISWGAPLMTIKQFRERLRLLEDNGNNSSIVSKIYEFRQKSTYRFNYKDSQHEIRHLEFWFDEDCFIKRRSKSYLKSLEYRLKNERKRN